MCKTIFLSFSCRAWTLTLLLTHWLWHTNSTTPLGRCKLTITPKMNKSYRMTNRHTDTHKNIHHAPVRLVEAAFVWIYSQFVMTNLNYITVNRLSSWELASMWYVINRLTIERHVLNLNAVCSSDAGIYECCAMNDLGTACTNFTLAVNNGKWLVSLIQQSVTCRQLSAENSGTLMNSVLLTENDLKLL